MHFLGSHLISQDEQQALLFLGEVHGLTRAQLDDLVLGDLHVSSQRDFRTGIYLFLQADDDLFIAVEDDVRPCDEKSAEPYPLRKSAKSLYCTLAAHEVSMRLITESTSRSDAKNPLALKN